MGLFRRNYRNVMSDEYRAALRKLRQQRSRWFRGVQIAVIFAAVMAVVFLILCIAVSDLRKPGFIKFCFVVFALSFGGAACLPWITQLERDRRRKANGENVPNWRFYVAYGFFGFIGLCTVLWVIAVFVIGDGIIMNAIHGEGDEIDPAAFTFLRVAIIVTIQAVYASVVATGLLRHGKRYLVLHTVMYIALAYLDVYLSWIAGGITFARIDEGNFPPIHNTFLWVLAIMTVVALAIASSILSAQVRRKEIELLMKGDVRALTEGDVNLLDAEAVTARMYDTADPFATEPPRTAEKSVEEQLKTIGELRDKGLITQEEYEKKRKDILDKL